MQKRDSKIQQKSTSRTESTLKPCQAEDALGQSEAFFKAIFDSSSDAIGVAKAAKYACGNQAFLDLFGYTRADELMGQPLSALIAPGGRAQFEEIVRSRAEGKPAPGLYETRGLRKDGTEFDVEVKSSTFELQGERYSVACARDITQRKLTDASLSEHERQNRGILDNMQDMYFRADLQGRFVLISPSAPRVYGYESVEEMIGIPAAALYFDPEERKKIIKEIQANGRVYDWVERGRKKDGSSFWVSMNVQLVRDEQGRVLGTEGVVRDITERKQVENALEKQNRALRSLHEITVAIGGELALSSLLRNIMTRAGDLLDADRGGGIYLYDEEIGALRLAEGSGINKDRVGTTLRVNEGVAGRVFHTSQPLITIDPLQSEEHATMGVSSPPSTVMSVPLFIQGEVIGVLNLLANSQQRVFSAQDVQLVEMFAAQMAISIQNASLYEATQRQIFERLHTEEKLRASEKRYRDLFENASLGVFQSASDGQIIEVNSEFARLFGYSSPQEVKAMVKNSADLFVDAQRRAEIIRLNAEQPGLKKFESTYVRKDGSNFIGQLTINSVLDAQGGLLYLEGFLENITERKHAEEALRVSEKSARRAVEQLQMVHQMSTTIAAGLDMEQLLQRFYEQCQQIGDTDTFYIGLYDDATGVISFPFYYIEGELQKKFSFNIRETPSLSGYVIQHRCTLYSPNKSKSMAFTNYAPNIHPDDLVQAYIGVPLIVNEQVVGVLSIQSNKPDAYSTDQVSTLEMLSTQVAIAIQNSRLYEQAQYERNLANALVDHLPGIFCLINQQGEMIRWNHYAEMLWGYTREEINQLDLDSVFIPDGHMQIGNMIELALKDGQAKGEGKLLTKGGQETPVFMVGTRVQINHQTYLLVIGLDITEKVEQEQELAAIAAFSSALRSYEPGTNILPVILRELNLLINVDASAISLQDIETARSSSVHFSTGAWESWAGAQVFNNRGAFELVSETNKAWVDENAACRDAADWPAPLGDIQSVVCLPLIASGQLIGGLWLGRKGKFSERNIHLLMNISDIASNAIHNAALYQQVEDRVATLTSLYSMGLALNSMAEPHAQLEFFSQIAMDELHAERMGYLRYLPEDLCFQMELCLGFNAELQGAIYQSRYPAHEDQTPMEWVRVNQLPVNNPDCRGDLALSFGDPDVRSVLWVPVQHGSHFLGVLVVLSSRANAFDIHQERLMVLFANQAAVALENAGLLYETQQQIQRLKSLRNIDDTINASFDLQVTTNVLLQQIIGQMKIDAADILIYHPDSKRLKYIDGMGFNTAALRFTNLQLGQGLAGRAALEREIIHVPDLAAQEEFYAASPLIRDEHFIEYYGVPLISKGVVKGVMEVYCRSAKSIDDSSLDFLRTLAGQAAIAIDNFEMFDNLQRSNQELIMAYDATIEGWSRALDLRDKETEGHTRRVTDITVQLAKAIEVQAEELVHIQRGALLHDIGKMGIPDAILLKPGVLSAEEWQIMRKHPNYAFDLLSTIAFLKQSLDIPYCHHEKWDGSGYPRGLKGEQIPISARLFAIVDVWDALTSDRPYRPAWPESQAIQYVREQVGKHFDPLLVEVFLNSYLFKQRDEQKPTL